MTREAIVRAASKMETTRDLLVLLNKIKMDELGRKGHPFTMPQLNYFIHPKRSAASYRTFTIPKKSGGVRTITAPVKMLKSFQTYANRILQAFYQAPECVTGFVPARSVVDNAERHIGRNYVFNTDLKDFFPSISQARVWGALKCRPFNFNATVAGAIAGLCCIAVTEDGEAADGGAAVRYVLPQGSPCSPALTNIVCHNLDWKLSGLARRFHLRYSRYADDITFSGNQHVFQADGAFMNEFLRIIAEQNFTINGKKTRLQKRGARQEVTGLVVSDRVNVSREYVRDLDNLLYIWEKHGRDAAFAQFMARYVSKHDRVERTPQMETVTAGRLMYLRMVKGEDSPVWRRLQKRFNRLIDRKESAAGTDIVYLHDYTIAAFETATGADIAYTMRPEGGLSETEVRQAESPAPAAPPVIAPTFRLNGRTHSVSISKYAKTRLRHILDSGDPQLLEKFREQFHIAYCKHDPTPEGVRDEDDRFWMIYRGMCQKTRDTALAAMDSVPETLPEGNGLSTDQVLAALVQSDYDLNILEQWDKIKRDS